MEEGTGMDFFYNKDLIKETKKNKETSIGYAFCDHHMFMLIFSFDSWSQLRKVLQKNKSPSVGERVHGFHHKSYYIP